MRRIRASFVCGIGLFILAVLAAVGCGKKAPPLPPIVLYPALIRDLVVRQEGTRFVLYFTQPASNNDGSPLVDLDRIEIYRIVEDQPPPLPPPPPQTQPASGQTQPASSQSQPAGQTQTASPPPAPSVGVSTPVTAAGVSTPVPTPGVSTPVPPAAPLPIPEVTVQDFASRGILIHTINALDVEKYRVGGYLSFTDTLEKHQPPLSLKKRFTYAVQPFNHRGRGPGFSNRITLDQIRLADPPRDQKAVVQELGVVIGWTAPVTNIDGTTPPNIVGYNIYRRLEADPAFPPDPINTSPMPVSPYLDTTALYGQRYVYVVKGASTAGRPYHETARTAEITVEPKDTFAPPAPINLVAVASKSGVNLLWSAVQARDLAGYRVYRRTGGESYKLITSDLILKNTFMDTTVKPRSTYLYVVTAVDNATPANESGHSNEAKEFVP